VLKELHLLSLACCRKELHQGCLTAADTHFCWHISVVESLSASCAKSLCARQHLLSAVLKELHQAIRSHAVPAMPYDPGEQGAGPGEHSDVLVAPDEEGQGAASSEIFSRAPEPSVISGRRLSHDAATISVAN
jgi:hypothetical protein